MYEIEVHCSALRYLPLSTTINFLSSPSKALGFLGRKGREIRIHQQCRLVAHLFVSTSGSGGRHNVSKTRGKTSRYNSINTIVDFSQISRISEHETPAKCMENIK
jgi:hypothetical protein